MQIIQKLDGTTLNLSLKGRLSSDTISELDDIVNNKLDNIKDLILDFSELEFISSAGLRILLIAHKKLENKGKMVILNPNDSVMEIFKITEFIDFLNIKKTE